MKNDDDEKFNFNKTKKWKSPANSRLFNRFYDK